MPESDNIDAKDGVVKEDSLGGGWADDKLTTDGAQVGDAVAADLGDTPGVAEVEQVESAEVPQPPRLEDRPPEQGAEVIIEPPLVDEPDAETPQPPKLEERGADLGTRPSGFADEKDAPEVEEEPITPNESLEQAQAQIKSLVKQNLKLRRELEESEHEINIYFNTFGPLPTE